MTAAPAGLVIEGVLTATGFVQTNGASFAEWLAAHDAEVRADQREKDAQIADSLIQHAEGLHPKGVVSGVASAIRAGGSTASDARPGGES